MSSFSREDMNTTQLYAIVADNSIIFLLIVRFVVYLIRLLAYCNTLLYKHVLLSVIVQRHRFLESWTQAHVSSQLIYSMMNILCLIFQASNVTQVSVCAEHLSLINMMSIYFECHLSFICDILDLFLSTYHDFHASTEIMSALFALLHVIIYVISTSSHFLDESTSMYELMMSDVSSESDLSAKFWS